MVWKMGSCARLNVAHRENIRDESYYESLWEMEFWCWIKYTNLK